jgi:uncharacterized protein (TIGR02594 family)
MSNSETIYRAMAKWLGTRETPGKASTKAIQGWIKQAAEWLDGDDSATAWCGCFRGSIGLETGTGVPKAHYRAASWAKWGTAVPLTRPSMWQRGDTIVMSRPGGNHVCVLDRVDGSRVWCLGGNQSDAVTVAPFPIDRISHVRRG